MNSPAHSARRSWDAWRLASLAVVVNVLIHLWIVSSDLQRETGASLMDRARIYTDEVPAPMNLWSTVVHLPAWLSAALTLWCIDDRQSLAALLLPQLAFLIVSSAQTALVVVGLFWLWQWGCRQGRSARGRRTE